LLFILLAMLVILAVAVLVVVYVAYPHRGEEMPNAPWVGEALKRTVDAVPTLEGEGGRPDDAQHDGPGDGDRERL
jgi:hypothetical protein